VASGQGRSYTGVDIRENVIQDATEVPYQAVVRCALVALEVLVNVPRELGHAFALFLQFLYSFDCIVYIQIQLREHDRAAAPTGDKADVRDVWKAARA
jgi:hypothetical protein